MIPAHLHNIHTFCLEVFFLQPLYFYFFNILIYHIMLFPALSLPEPLPIAAHMWHSDF